MTYLPLFCNLIVCYEFVNRRQSRSIYTWLAGVIDFQFSPGLLSTLPRLERRQARQSTAEQPLRGREGAAARCRLKASFSR